MGKFNDFEFDINLLVVIILLITHRQSLQSFKLTDALLVVDHQHLVQHKSYQLEVTHYHHRQNEQYREDAVVRPTLLDHHILLPWLRQIHEKPVKWPRNVHYVDEKNWVVDFRIIVSPNLIFTVPCFDMVCKQIVFVLCLVRCVNGNEHCYRTEEHVESKPILNLCRAFLPFKLLWIAIRVLIMLSPFIERSKKCHIDH